MAESFYYTTGGILLVIQIAKETGLVRLIRRARKVA